MTCKDLIMSIVDSPDQKGYDMSVDDARKLIAIAYYMGRESAARDVSDAYNAVLAAQIQRASGCRYRNMAMTIQGNVKYVYSSDYSGDMTSIFGADITYLTHDNLSNCTIAIQPLSDNMCVSGAAGGCFPVGLDPGPVD